LAFTNTLDVEFRWGNRRRINFLVTLSGVAQNIAGWSFTFTAKRSLRDADAAAVFQLTLGSGLTITDAPGGALQAIIQPSHTTATLNPYDRVELQADLKAVDAAGNPYTLLSGTLTVLPAVTRG
jgi:hypothetical protein